MQNTVTILHATAGIPPLPSLRHMTRLHNLCNPYQFYLKKSCFPRQLHNGLHDL